MQQQQDINFNNKFRLLCSQENKEDIVWSTDSSDYENVETEKVFNTTKLQNKKRKRKIKVPKNISNLDITIIDTNNDPKSRLDGEKNILPVNDCDGKSSPILKSQYQQKYSNVVFTSPILSSNILNVQNKGGTVLKSPILVLKTISPTYSPKVRKKLFNNDIRTDKEVERIYKSKTVVDANKMYENKRHNYNVTRSLSMYNNDCKTFSKVKKPNLDNKIILSDRSINDTDIQFEKKESHHEEKNILDESTDLLRPANLDMNLVKKVKSYFDCQFSSESASQHSINDTPTPKNSSKNSSKTSDDVDISNTVTQIQSNRNSMESIKEDVLEINQKSKKFRYKKDGLAFRLNSILKKYNANISLWQHERFLAANSNFVIPKGDHLIFHIRNVQFKYSCYLLEAKDVENYDFLILINNDYVTDRNISKDDVFKLYEPYKISEFDDKFKLIINVCKFECVSVC